MKRTERRSTRNRFSFLPALVAMALMFAVFMTAGKPGEARPWRGHSNSGNSRVMVILNTEITDSLIIELADYGKIHGWIERYNLVAMTPKRGMRASVAALWFVDVVETDQVGELLDVGTWDRDIIDAVDVEETGFVGDPDEREVEETGVGVHVAVIDTGLLKEWRDFLDESRVDTSLARAFLGGGEINANELFGGKISNPTNLWERDVRGHGLAVASHIIGFKAGNVLVDGVAPSAVVIPLKVYDNNKDETYFTSRLIAAIAYVTGLVEDGVIGPTVINMSLGGTRPVRLLEIVINDAIAAGITLVAAAGNDDEQGMRWPGAYPQMISAGAVGWNEQFRPGSVDAPNFDYWWTQDVGFDPDRGRRGREANEVWVAPFSSRAIPDLVPGFSQELDVLAPGAFTVAPFRVSGILPVASQPGLLQFVNGTSFASPLTAGVAALILEKNPMLGQSEIEDILKSTALPLKAVGSRSDILIPFPLFPGAPGVFTFSWDTDCFGLPCDAVGAGLVQADDALAATPTP